MSINLHVKTKIKGRSQPKRSFLEAEDALKVLPFGKEKDKYKFFKMLEKSVYEGDNTKEFRDLYKLPQLHQNETYTGFHSGGGGQPKEIQKTRPAIIPYWEFHYYNNGFNAFSLGGAALWFDNVKDNEQHFYFTLRSLFTDENYEKLEEAGLITRSFSHEAAVMTDVGNSR